MICNHEPSICIIIHACMHDRTRTCTAYARDHQPCIIFMDEIDAIGGRRFSEGTSADREIQRTLMELLNQMDGFDRLGQVKMIMATNRPDVLDPALLRPGRLDRKIGTLYSLFKRLVFEITLIMHIFMMFRDPSA